MDAVHERDSAQRRVNTIRDATEAGTLGCGAKTAIPVPDANPLYANSGYLLTCIYTYDFDDQKDVRRVLTGLRQLGFTHRLSYKSDADTLSGTYGPGSAMYVSQPNSLDFEDRRVTR